MRLTVWIPAVLFAAANLAAAQPTDGLSDLRTAARNQLMSDIRNLMSHVALGNCASLINGDTSLRNDAELIDLGFEEIPETAKNPGASGYVVMARTVKNGYVTIGGIPGSICEVNAVGPQAADALKDTRSGVSSFGIDFTPDPANSGKRGNGTIEALKMQYSDTGQIQAIFVNGATVDGTPTATFQIKIQEQ
jgi:hypothetical protein